MSGWESYQTKIKIKMTKRMCGEGALGAKGWTGPRQENRRKYLLASRNGCVHSLTMNSCEWMGQSARSNANTSNNKGPNGVFVRLPIAFAMEASRAKVDLTHSTMVSITTGYCHRASPTAQRNRFGILREVVREAFQSRGERIYRVAADYLLFGRHAPILVMHWTHVLGGNKVVCVRVRRFAIARHDCGHGMEANRWDSMAIAVGERRSEGGA